MSRRFQPRAWAFVLACVACAGAVALGNWQRGRAAEKQQLATRISEAEREAPLDLNLQNPAASEALWRRVRLRGEFLGDKTVYLDNRSRGGRAGYEVVTPLRLDPARHVLVNRGWLPAAPRRDANPSVRTPSASVRIDGIVVDHIGRVFAPGSDPGSGPVRLNLEVAEFAKSSGLALLPFVVEQLSDADDGLLREWQRPDTGIDRHLMYAGQWYLLGALAAALFVIFSFRRIEADAC